MSAFIVPHAHIDALVSWAVHHRVPLFPAGITPAVVAAFLFEENCRSVDYRYGEVNPRDYRYENRPGARELSPVQILKACNCLEYQSCEHPDWEDSRARACLASIRAQAVRMLPGYEDADWTLDAWKPELLVAGGAA